MVEAYFHDLVGDIALDFSANVHDVQTEDYEGEVKFSWGQGS